jgi:predicted  nucleic acid-binding Zn-ribbon protein
MNTDTQTQNTERQTLAARIINVLADEILLRIDSRTNGALISLSNRITDLDVRICKLAAKIEDGLHPDNFPTEERVRELIDEQAVSTRALRDLRDGLDNIDSRLEEAERVIHDLEDEKVSSDELEDTVRDAVDMAQSRQDAESIVREGLKAIIDGKI